MSSSLPLEAVSLIGISRQPLQSLAGFDKSRHKSPKIMDDWAAAFVAKVADEDVDDDLEAVFQKLRQQYRFKRVEIRASKPLPGCGLIQTPFFCYSVQIQPDADDPDQVYWERSVRKIATGDKVLCSEFSQVFDFVFDRVEFCFDTPLDLEQWIDGIESKEDEELQLSYDSKLTYCCLTMDNLAADIHICSSSVTITLPELDRTSNILSTFLKIRETIRAGISLA